MAGRPLPDRVSGLDRTDPLAAHASTLLAASTGDWVLATEDSPAAWLGAGTASDLSAGRASVGVEASLAEVLAGAVGVLASDGPIGAATGDPAGRSAILTGTTLTGTRRIRTIRTTVIARTTVLRHTIQTLRTTTTRQVAI